LWEVGVGVGNDGFYGQGERGQEEWNLYGRRRRGRVVLMTGL